MKMHCECCEEDYEATELRYPHRADVPSVSQAPGSGCVWGRGLTQGGDMADCDICGLTLCERCGRCIRLLRSAGGCDCQERDLDWPLGRLRPNTDRIEREKA